MKDNSEKRFFDILQTFNTAILVTHQEHRMHGRPMVVAKIEPDGRIWFLTDRDSPKIAEIRENSEVTVVCQDERYRTVVIMGTAELSQDRSKIEELWKAEFRSWFPDGAGSPNIMLIEVHGQEAEFWDNHGLKGVRYLFKAIAAIAKGERPRIEEGKEHGRVNLAA